MPRRKYGYKIQNGHMEGRSKNLCSVEVAAVVDLSLDDVDGSCQRLWSSDYFFPKFHCELNFIEMVWGWMKSYDRRHCTCNYNHFKSDLPSTMLSEMPIAFVRRAARHCYRFMSGYRQGLDGPLLDYTMKKYSGHRRIPDVILVEV